MSEKRGEETILKHSSLNIVLALVKVAFAHVKSFRAPITVRLLQGRPTKSVKIYK